MRWLFVKRLRPYVLLAGGASLVLNLALLVSSIYMLHVFDRGFASRSEEILLMLSLLALPALALGYFADSARTEALSGASRTLDRFLSRRPFGRHDIRREIAAMRAFLSSNGVLALFDAPWVPLYLLVIALIHPLLGITATIGTVLLIGLVVLAERLTRRQIDGDLRELFANEPLGLLARRVRSLARIGRYGLQLGMLALAAWLVIAGRASPGIIIAATILLGRALQPVEQLISGHNALLEVRASWAGLSLQPANLAFSGYVDRPVSDPVPYASLKVPAASGRIGKPVNSGAAPATVVEC